jgi:hypothetical protein
LKHAGPVPVAAPASTPPLLVVAPLLLGVAVVPVAGGVAGLGAAADAEGVAEAGTLLPVWFDVSRPGAGPGELQPIESAKLVRATAAVREKMGVVFIAWLLSWDSDSVPRKLH